MGFSGEKRLLAVGKIPADAAVRPKIVGILKAGIGWKAFPTYRCGAAEAQAVGVRRLKPAWWKGCKSPTGKA